MIPDVFWRRSAALKGKCMRRQMQKLRAAGKLYELWHDRRSFPVRLRIALLCAAAFCFTVIVFGPLELFIGNSGFFPFSFGVVGLLWL